MSHLNFVKGQGKEGMRSESRGQGDREEKEASLEEGRGNEGGHRSACLGRSCSCSSWRVFARTLCGVWEPPTASDTKGGVERERLITWSLRNRGQAYGGKFSETRA